ncbi:3'(2'),5'-bisphosphate nucleotidase CysQ [Candidatus Erwinia haradaeae]|uniref:3'(2'),5'-bisphosphate nucleotidase CysQ n=1 Tax=Candidatus Erwinia haradaeae TaxID=1922217 RepID=A0A451DDN9_9GAMM|nr:3'(2'),5'-bisphosphate nucleotidase CysQ [Candidatus Erwinia haradaeae]VFP84551.1 3'(2'),5'-bisphosphate nucleotidase CysQ [Candidatus Erwinia haradaeae]
MLKTVCHLAREAGNAITKVYDKEIPLNLQHKKNHSIVTAADIAAHKIIAAGLRALTPEIPILSEEAPLSWEARKTWKQYWLVDPLDGTKEFIQRNGEFTVNIALIDQGQPILGVIYAPILSIMYCATKKEAWKEYQGHHTKIHVQELHPPIIVVSRSHIDSELTRYLHTIGEHKIIAMGSSLKFCMIAEGKAQIYPRHGSTNIWDTGAGHAIAVAAGAAVHDWQGKELDYTPKKSYLNQGFCVSVIPKENLLKVV